MEYLADVGITLLIYIGLAVSLNLLMGYGGQVSMAQGAFYGIGAYTAGILAIRYNWHALPAIIAALVLSFLCASIVSLPAARRVTGEFLILLTLAFQTVVTQLMISLRDFTGGPYGLSPIPPITVFGRSLVKPSQFVLLMVIVVSSIVAVAWRIGESPFGRLLKGIREDEVAVRALGKNTTVVKLLLFGITSALAGVVGAVSAYYYQFIAPGTYNLDLSIFLVSIVVLGGVANFTGTILAAIILGSVQPILQNIGWIGSENSYPWQAVIYGLAVVMLMRLRPEGLLPEGMGLRRVLHSRGPAEPKESATCTDQQGTVAILNSAVDQTRHTAQIKSGRKSRVALQMIDQANNSSLGDTNVILRTVDLAKRFGGVWAVNGVELILRRGEITALIGPNGAGKTTIFNLITGALTPDRGRVFLRGIDITGKTADEVARLGMVRSFQDVRLCYRLSALENVAMAVPNQPGENLARLVFQPRLSRRAEEQTLAIADRYLELVGLGRQRFERVADLSYAEQKLVAIARLLATECEVLLLDEPTAGIDPAALNDMIGLIRELRDAGKTICIVEHSLHVVEQLADHVVFLEEGRILAEGDMSTLLRQEHLVEMYFGT